MSWTDKEVETLKTLWARGLGVDEIACQMRKNIDEVIERAEVLKALEEGKHSVQQSMEKAMKSFDEIASFNKSSVDAFVQTARAASKGIEAISAQVLSYSEQSVEDAMAATKAAIGSRSVQVEFLEINTDYAKTAFGTYIGRFTKLGDMATTAAKDTLEPLGRYVNTRADFQAPQATQSSLSVRFGAAFADAARDAVLRAKVSGVSAIGVGAAGEVPSRDAHVEGVWATFAAYAEAPPLLRFHLDMAMSHD